MHIHVITIFPQLIENFLEVGIPRIACAKGKLVVDAVDLRSFAADGYQSVDDRPFGGGPGMVMLAPPIFRAVEFLAEEHGPSHRILLTPKGRRLEQSKLRQLATKERVVILCGRYEGIDERVRTGLDWDEVSLGDFVLSGGEIAAMTLIDGIARLLSGVLGHPDSAHLESFENGLLEAPQYTRPRVFRGMEVPQVLLSGNHREVERWRHHQALELTRARRADLLRQQGNDSNATG